jgi:hypothetical protein
MKKIKKFNENFNSEKEIVFSFKEVRTKAKEHDIFFKVEPNDDGEYNEDVLVVEKSDHPKIDVGREIPINHRFQDNHGFIVRLAKKGYKITILPIEKDPEVEL